ncbi:hypothetical protein CDAR_27531 [Caerostris darwini]|uniref:Uncharacterized protein n=1 Tax=Caerostris darwini TaxID=1538125 RepID=A0AAV4VX82_9ARAC|nr:hypothetical protein CDAR_27531 [Caerostris darwini]
MSIPIDNNGVRNLGSVCDLPRRISRCENSKMNRLCIDPNSRRVLQRAFSLFAALVVGWDGHKSPLLSQGSQQIRMVGCGGGEPVREAPLQTLPYNGKSFRWILFFSGT